MKFESRWLKVSPSLKNGTDKTDKSTFVSDVSSVSKGFDNLHDAPKESFTERKDYDLGNDHLTKPETEETFPNPLDVRDVLAFPIRLLGDLPLPPVLVIEVPGFDTTVVLDFRKRATWRRKPKARPTFENDEIEALTEAAENGCVRPRDFVLWCQRKQRDPNWRLDRATALHGDNELIRNPPKPKNWTVARLLDALGAKLRLIKIVYQGAKTAGHGPYAEATQ